MPTRPSRTASPEDFSIDQSKHSLFGASKVAARCHGAGIRAILRHADVLPARRLPDRPEPLRRGTARIPELSHQVQSGRPRVQGYGYKGKQVRDNIHSEDVARFMLEFYQDAPVRRRFTTSAAARQIRAPSSKPLRWRRSSPERSSDRTTWTRTGSAITSAITAICENEIALPQWKPRRSLPAHFSGDRRVVA